MGYSENMSFGDYVQQALHLDYGKTVEQSSSDELYNACGKAINALCFEMKDNNSRAKKRACYFSAEFLLGRLLYAALYNLGVNEEATAFLEKRGRSLSEFDAVEDAALGNGGLGRLAACFLDSAACLGIPLDGYGIRYRYGLFKQQFVDNAQTQLPDDWLTHGDPFGVRRDSEAVNVDFADMTVLAVPYDYNVIGTGGCVNRLRLFQCESLNPFSLEYFGSHDFEAAFNSADAQAVSAVLYPPDSDDEGKKLRIRQQYFFCSAALQCILRENDEKGLDIETLPERIVVQLNDTHPTVAIPELIRLLTARGLSFDKAFDLCSQIFAYTNHTVMGEALEKWDVRLYEALLPDVYAIIKKINARLKTELEEKSKSCDKLLIIRDGTIHMANLAVYCSFSVNGVAKLHTQILKNDVFSEWYGLFPQRFSNKTNGVTQRRWLALANPELTSLLKTVLGDDFIERPESLSELRRLSADEKFISNLKHVKQHNKLRLAEYIRENDGVEIDPASVFCVQIKRVHEYKRQLMNALSIANLYLMVKSGELKNLPAVTFIFGGKAASGYKRAKAVIRYINALAELINSDIELDGVMKVVFVSNYNVSAAQIIIPAADISEQLSLAGTEASGTGNMKFMMNGAVTLGTYDGANIEIVEQAGEENNYIFGMREQEVEALRESYNPKELYSTNPSIKRAVDTLIDGTVSDNGSGEFKELYNSLLKNDEWQTADRYFVLEDLTDYTDTRLRAISDCGDGFGEKSLLNIAGSGIFSSDRTISEYAKQIWFPEE